MKSTIKKCLAGCLMLALILPFVPEVRVLAGTLPTAATTDELAVAFAREGIKRSAEIKVNYTGPESDITKLLKGQNYYKFYYGILSVNDDPSTSDDADYLIGNIRYSDKGAGFTFENGVVTFTPEYFETLAETQYVNAHIKEILTTLKVESMTNYNKVKTIHDYICKLITYTNTGSLLESSMYGALTQKKALCNAYALCMYKLLVEAGVPCKFIGGRVGSGKESTAHAWNIVALGDKWYHVDATWDDDDETVKHDYFLKGKLDFDEVDPSQKHTMDKPYSQKPFSTVFPIANYSFEKGSNDKNTRITIGGTDPGDADEEVGYQESDIVTGTYPKKRVFTIKKNQMMDIQIHLKNKKAASRVSDVTYKFTEGKARVKNIKNYGILKDDEGYYYTDLEFIGKKKGKVAVKITLEMEDGREFVYKFTGKIKKK